MSTAVTRIYHMTHVDNLEGILTAGGLLPKGQGAHVHQRVNSAYADIQQRRAAYRVPVGPGGSLHDYVPFYFGYLSPMLYAIHTGRVPGSDGKQGNMVYLFSTIERVVSGGLPYVFTDGHAAMQLTEYYSELADLSHVDFKVANARYRSDTEEDSDRKHREQSS